MVNHALMLGIQPWIIHYGEEQQAYYKRIVAHPTTEKFGAAFDSRGGF
jgi:hypothetical protein